MIRESFCEIDGRIAVSDEFSVRGRADRIDILTGGGAALLDYKTGQAPTDKQIKAFLAPQLLLEGAMIRRGGFAEVGNRSPDELL